MRPQANCTKNSVTDPGSRAFLNPGPGSGIRNKPIPDPGSRIPNKYFLELSDKFWVKNSTIL
jgi:hypothetical protein